VTLKCGDLTGHALRVYIPSRRKVRHYADAFSRALFLAKRLGQHCGAQLAWDLAGELVPLLPAGAELLATPPASRQRAWHLARELTVAVAAKAGLAVAGPLRWAVGRQVECLEDLIGRRVVIVDDLWTTGITAAQTAAALREAGAEVLGVVTLALTEPTRARPANERRWRHGKAGA